MAPSFWTLYHILGLTGLSIKRTLGLILSLSGKNTIIKDEYGLFTFLCLKFLGNSFRDFISRAYSISRSYLRARARWLTLKYCCLNVISDESECASSSINFPKCIWKSEDCHKWVHSQRLMWWDCVTQSYSQTVRNIMDWNYLEAILHRSLHE